MGQTNLLSASKILSKGSSRILEPCRQRTGSVRQNEAQELKLQSNPAATWLDTKWQGRLGQFGRRRPVCVREEFWASGARNDVSADPSNTCNSGRRMGAFRP